MSIEGGLTKIYTHETFENSLMDFSFPLAYPIVKWAGGKTQLLRKLTEHRPAEFNRYFEPFLGGGALFFYLSSAREPRFTAYLSDINQELISMYEVVKSNVEDLIDILRVYTKEYEKSPVKFYYNLRDRIDRNATSLEKAARTITLNRTCYNGLYRVNRNGEFNVPIGRYKKPVICDSTNLHNASLVLRSLESHLYSRDYQKILTDNAEKGDFIYLDPPYNPTTSTANFTGYTHTGFTERDQERLAKTFSELDMRGCKVLLNNSDTEYVKELYIDYAKNIHQVNVRRSINSKTSKRTGYTELLIRNYSK